MIQTSGAKMEAIHSKSGIIVAIIGSHIESECMKYEEDHWIYFSRTYHLVGWKYLVLEYI
jgi:hypothetical protein